MSVKWTAAGEGVQSRLRFCIVCGFEDWSLEILGDGKVGRIYHRAQAELARIFRSTHPSKVIRATQKAQIRSRKTRRRK